MPGNPTNRRYRPLPCKLPSARIIDSFTYTDGTVPPVKVTIHEGGPIDLTGSQVTDSESHAFHSNYKKGSIRGDLGGPFRTVKQYAIASNRNYRVTHVDGPSAYRFDGPVIPHRPTEFPPSGESSDLELNSVGATAIAQCAPGNPPADVVTFLGELLKDGIPSLVGHQSWKDRASASKAAGSEYLNLMFGWKPLVNDIKSFANSLIHAEKILSQYERDAGKVVRRRMQFSTTKNVSQEEVGIPRSGFSTVSSSWMYDSRPVSRPVRTRVTERRRWFSGAFTYHLPVGYDSRETMRGLASQAQHLLGANVTPDVLWELAPWSWAIDWFSNTGDVIHNLSRFATGGLVMRYGYMMEHSIVKDIYTLPRTALRGHDAIAPLTMVTETKKRVQANPFGFGVSWDGLSSFQTSILAALGITRFGR